MIEHEGKRWLFDTGQTDVFMKNAALLGERLMGLNGIILSHGHFDHCGGLKFLAEEYRKAGIDMPPVYVRETAFLGKTAINSDRRTYRIIGIPWKRELIESSIRLTERKQEIAGVWVLGDIPYTPGLEKRPEQFFIEDGPEKRPDYMNDEQMLLFETGKALPVCRLLPPRDSELSGIRVTGISRPKAAQRLCRNALNRRICAADYRDRRGA